MQNKALPTQLSVDDLYRARHAIWNVMIDYYCHSIRNAEKVGKYIQSRDVGLISSSIINMVTFCAHSDSIMLIPKMFVPMLTKKFPVQCHKLPAEFDMKYDCYMHFNTQITEDEQAMKFVDNVMSNVRDSVLESVIFYPGIAMKEISLKKLKVVNTLIECGSAAKAAKVLGISPSAIKLHLKAAYGSTWCESIHQKKQWIKT
ncbi:hypothetical protein ACSPAB_11800 [Buttiauxella agrestis]